MNKNRNLELDYNFAIEQYFELQKKKLFIAFLMILMLHQQIYSNMKTL